MKTSIFGFAFALVVLIFSACEVDDGEPAIDDLQLCIYATNGKCPGDQSVFSSSDPQVYAAVKVVNAEKDETVTFVWYYESGGEYSEIARASLNLEEEAGEASTYNAASFLQFTSGTLPIGDFEVEATLGSGDSAHRSFYVQ